MHKKTDRTTPRAKNSDPSPFAYRLGTARSGERRDGLVERVGPSRLLHRYVPRNLATTATPPLSTIRRDSRRSANAAHVRGAAHARAHPPLQVTLGGSVGQGSRRGGCPVTASPGRLIAPVSHANAVDELGGAPGVVAGVLCHQAGRGAPGRAQVVLVAGPPRIAVDGGLHSERLAVEMHNFSQ